MAGWLKRWVLCGMFCAWLAFNPASWAAAQDAAAPEATPDTAVTSSTLDAARQTYQRLMAEKRYEEAQTIAGQLVEIATRLHGANSIELAEPLADLAAAQFQRGDLANAQANYSACIAIIERTDGIVSPRLVAPLTGLGDTYLKAGFYPQAVDAYEHALHANHAQDGFYNSEQTPILDGLSEGYLGMNKLADANAQQRYQVTVQQRRSGPDSLETVPALYKLARWYNRTGQYGESRSTYQSAMRVIDRSGDGNPAMVDALTGAAVTFLNEGDAVSSAGMLLRALDLLEAQPTRDHLKHAEVLVDLGDLYTLTGQTRSARQRYSEAWQELSGDDVLLAEREKFFGQPARITGPRLPDVVGANGAPLTSPPASNAALADGYALASMTVDASGRARDVVIIESDPTGLLDQRVLRALKDTAFRPKMTDGETVDSANVQFRHAFRFLRTAAAGRSAPASNAGDSGREKPISYPGQDNSSPP